MATAKSGPHKRTDSLLTIIEGSQIQQEVSYSSAGVDAFYIIEERYHLSSVIIYAQDLWIDVFYPNRWPASLERGRGRKEVFEVMKSGKS